MPVIYAIFSIAGWTTLGLLLCFWGVVACLKKSEPRDSESSMDFHEKHP